MSMSHEKPATYAQNPYYQNYAQTQGASQQPMMYPYYQNQMGQPIPQQNNVQIPQPKAATPVVEEESYIENILRLNKGKEADVYMTFENDQQKVFTGIVEAAGRDHIIISEPDTGKRYLLLMVYLDYITFDEELDYAYPYNGTSPNRKGYPPRS